MNSKEVENLIGVPEKSIRSYARKNFTKTGRTWDFNEDQAEEILQHFCPGIDPEVEKLAGLTENEILVLDWLITKGWWNGEQSFSDVTAQEVADGIERPIKSVKGYLGSLVKKNYIYIEQLDDNSYSIIYPNEGEQGKMVWNEKTSKYEY